MYVFRAKLKGKPLFCFACGQEVDETSTPDLQATGLYAHDHSCPENMEDEMAICFITGRRTDCTPVINRSPIKDKHIRPTDCEIYLGKCRKELLDWAVAR